MGPRIVERMTNEIRILAWRECITTLMVFYHQIRDMLIHVTNESFKKGLSLPLLIQRIASKFLEAYFSSTIDEKVENFFKPPGD